jgi:hypothetical protein
MAKQREQLELQINRYLDGELTSEEVLALQREMLRDQEARELAESLSQADAALADVLQADLPVAEPAFDPLALTEQHAQARCSGSRRAWWMIPAALAACLVASFILPAFQVPDGGTTGGYRAGANLTDLPAFESPDLLPASSSTAHEVQGIDHGIRRASAGEGPRQVNRRVDRDLIGIVGDDGEIYWIEIDRTRTVRTKSTRSDSLVRGGL